jgi:predicted transcriptional regulator
METEQEFQLDKLHEDILLYVKEVTATGEIALKGIIDHFKHVPEMDVKDHIVDLLNNQPHPYLRTSKLFNVTLYRLTTFGKVAVYNLEQVRNPKEITISANPEAFTEGFKQEIGDKDLYFLTKLEKRLLHCLYHEGFNPYYAETLLFNWCQIGKGIRHRDMNKALLELVTMKLVERAIKENTPYYKLTAYGKKVAEYSKERITAMLSKIEFMILRLLNEKDCSFGTILVSLSEFHKDTVDSTVAKLKRDGLIDNRATKQENLFITEKGLKALEECEKSLQLLDAELKEDPPSLPDEKKESILRFLEHKVSANTQCLTMALIFHTPEQCEKEMGILLQEGLVLWDAANGYWLSSKGKSVLKDYGVADRAKESVDTPESNRLHVLTEARSNLVKYLFLDWLWDKPYCNDIDLSTKDRLEEAFRRGFEHADGKEIKIVRGPKTIEEHADELDNKNK